jgi:hypothetical protein
MTKTYNMKKLSGGHFIYGNEINLPLRRDDKKEKRKGDKKRGRGH